MAITKTLIDLTHDINSCLAAVQGLRPYTYTCLTVKMICIYTICVHNQLHVHVHVLDSWSALQFNSNSDHFFCGPYIIGK